MAHIRRKRITGKQRVARQRNIAIARMHKLRKIKGIKKVDKVIKKNVDYFNDEAKLKKPMKKTVFRTMKKQELKNIKKGERSGKFWSSDPGEYGRHALGRIGNKSSETVLVAAKSSGRNRSYRGLGSTKNRHFNEINSKSKKDIFAVYEWNGRRLKRKK